VIIAVGGDGTIGECATGYIKADGKAKNVAFAVFPCGKKKKLPF